MESARLMLSRENPRTLAFTKPTLSEPAQKASPSVVDRFRALLKQREDELKIDADDDVVLPPSASEIVRLYELMLSELNFNSKPIITDLTIIAGEQREHAEGIAGAICSRIIEVPVDQKLPSLYLLDSIVKNIGREYIRYFSSRLPQVFCEAYRQVHPDLHSAMRHLFGTWSAVFPPPVLRKIDVQLQFSPQVNNQSSSLNPLRSSESPRPTHGIHVNPKYLRQLEQHSTMDSNIQQGRRVSSNTNMYGQKAVMGYDEYDSDHVEATSLQVDAQRFSSPGSAGRTSFALGANKSLQSSSARLASPSSPSRAAPDRSLSVPVDEFAANNIPRGVVERASSSHQVSDYGLFRALSRRDNDSSDRQGKHTLEDNRRRVETSAYNPINRDEHQRPRALIDAYGTDKGKRMSNNKPLQVEGLEINGIDNNIPLWQNTEEEEFDWEKNFELQTMSPTFAEPLSTSGNFSARPHFGTHAAPLEADSRRSNWSSQASLSREAGSSVITEIAGPSLGSGRGSSSKISGFQTKTNIRDSSYPPEAWNFPHHLPQSSQHLLNTKERGTHFQMPFSASYKSLPAGEKLAPLTDDLPEVDGPLHRHPTVAPMGFSGIDSVKAETGSASVLPSVGAWHPVHVHTSHQPPLHLILPQKKQIQSRLDLMNASNLVTRQGQNQSLFMPEQQLNNFESKVYSSTNFSQVGLIPSNQQTQKSITNLQPQFARGQDARQNVFSSAVAPVSSHLVPLHLNHGYTHGSVVSSVMSNPLPAGQLTLPVQSIPNSSLHLQGGALPPLPLGPPPASSQLTPISQNGPIGSNQLPGTAFSGLIGTLMAQGLISLTNQAPVQEFVGIEFNADLFKVRHESAIYAIHGALPRQCKTCGLRFKCQEEHSSHMDWHVTKNRMSKNRKQKPSRKWFVNADMWLSSAEALGTDAVPGFLPAESIVEKENVEEMSVPADEDQNVCALCGEPFDDFYSDETEEWMYKGAVYLNAPDGSTAGMNRSQLGPIVHAKCRTESSLVHPENLGQDEEGSSEEGRQKKRMRI